MGITRAVLGAVAAAGVARLLAPTETKRVMKSAGRTVRAGAKAVQDKAMAITKATGKAKPRKTATARSVSKETMKGGRPKKAAKRPVRKASR